MLFSNWEFAQTFGIGVNFTNMSVIRPIFPKYKSFKMRKILPNCGEKYTLLPGNNNGMAQNLCCFEINFQL